MDKNFITKNSDSTLEEIVKRLVRSYQPLRVFLFGSEARGDAEADSDYDIMVIVPDDAEAERKTSRLAYRALRGTGCAADILVWTRKAFEERLHLRASLPAIIAKEGKLMYGE